MLAVMLWSAQAQQRTRLKLVAASSFRPVAAALVVALSFMQAPQPQEALGSSVLLAARRVVLQVLVVAFA